MTGRTRALAWALPAGMLCGLLAGACDSTVTSIGAWEPITMQSEAGGGQGATAGGGQGATAGSGGGSGGLLGDAGAAGETGSPGFYLEAELGELSGAFIVGSDVAASNDQFIQAPPTAFPAKGAGTAHARYQFDVPADGNYVIWGRIFSPDIDSNRFWFRVDGGDWILWRITVGAIWYWHFFNNDIAYDTVLHFPLTAGNHVLELDNAAPDTKLDRLYITPGSDRPPGNNTKCRPPHSIDPGDGGDCKLSCGAQAPPGMHSSCVCDAGVPTFPAYDCGGGSCCAKP